MRVNGRLRLVDLADLAIGRVNVNQRLLGIGRRDERVAVGGGPPSARADGQYRVGQPHPILHVRRHADPCIADIGG